MTTALKTQKKLKTGIEGLNKILNGGIPENRLYLMQGEPGTGKTTIAFQFLLEGIKNGERCLYISFSESREELESVAASHNWDISKLNMLELGSIEEQLKPEAQNTVFHPSEVEMNETMNVLYSEIERIKPHRVVFDSISEMRMLAESSLRYRRQMLALKQFFAKQNCTVLMLDDLTTSPKDLQVQSIVHGVVHLQKLHPEFGTERRRLNVVKLRGMEYLGGFHDYVIEVGGVQIFPRMVSADHESKPAPHKKFSSGLKELDNLLGGGLESGTSTLFLGPAGTGKSTLAIQYAYAAAERGEKAALFCFEESLNTLIMRTKSVGMNVQKHIDSGMMIIHKIDPAQLSPGEFTHLIKSAVEEGCKVVSIDSLNGYLHAMPEEQFLTLQLHELLSYLGSQRILTLMVLAQQGMMGHMMNTPIDLTYLADTVLITRYFENNGSVRKAISVIKQRSGLHESTIRELMFTPTGLVVGKPLTDFKGVLTGVPEFTGTDKGLQKNA